MSRCNNCIRFGRCGSQRSGEVSKRLGLSSASRCSSSHRMAISQNSRVSGADSLMEAPTVLVINKPGNNAGLLGSGLFLRRSAHVCQLKLLAEPCVGGLLAALGAEPLGEVS